MAVRAQYKITLARVNDGAKGDTGSAGQGVSAVKTQYYLSSSNTSQTGGSWSDTVPSYKSGYYYWTRMQITWTNPSKTTYTTAVLDNALTNANGNALNAKNAVDNLEIGGRNLLRGTVGKGKGLPSQYTAENPLTVASKTKDTAVPASQLLWYAPIEPGETYIFQACTDGTWGNHITDGTGGGVTHFYMYLQTAEDVSKNYDTYTSPIGLINNLRADGKTGGTGRAVWKYTVPSNKEYVRATFRIDVHGDGETEYTTKYWHVKFEKGTQATDWTPAPEDVQEEIAKTVKSVSQEYYLSTSSESAAGGSWSSDLPARTDGTFYWIRYKITYQDGTFSYSPSANGRLLSDINDLWAQVTENKSSIKNTDSQVQINSTKITSYQNSLDGKVDKSDFESASSQTNDSLTEIREQIATLTTKSDSITAQVTDNQKAIGEVKQATAQLTADGLNVDTGLTTVSTVDGRGLTITDKSNDETIANFTTGESTIQNLKIVDQLKTGAHIVYKMTGTEYDGSEKQGTGFMWTGGS